LNGEPSQDDLYRDAADKYGSALERLARAYEADPEKRRDLIQQIHFQLWRSFQRFDARCSARTWVYRVAHHVAASHVLRERRIFSKLVSLEELQILPGGPFAADQHMNLERLSMLIQQLKPLDRQVIVSYLEDMDAASIGEITGLSPGNVAMRITGSRTSWRGGFTREAVMRNDPSGNDPRTIWQNQPTETTTMTLKLVRWKGRELHAKTRKHLLGTLAAPLAAIFLYALAIRLFSPLQQLLHPLFALTLVWSLAGLYFLNRGMWSPELPGDAGLSSGLEFCRREIERRCYLLRRVLLWAFGPVLPAIGTYILE